MSAPLELPQEILERIRALCLALPEVTVRVDESRSAKRSSAHSFDIRRRSFCLLIAVEGPRTGRAVALLVLRVDPDDREAMLSVGHPFSASRHRDRINVRLTADTDWDEIRELVTDSYRILAPTKLTARLDE